MMAAGRVSCAGPGPNAGGNLRGLLARTAETRSASAQLRKNAEQRGSVGHSPEMTLPIVEGATCADADAITATLGRAMGGAATGAGANEPFPQFDALPRHVNCPALGPCARKR
ncbi:hypothetical protein MRX96_047442 [Rhipicephalus microplus]